MTRALVGMALVWSLVARADPAEDTARAHYKQGLTAYDLRKFEDALSAFSAAYAADPLPGFLFNIAQCERQLGHWDRAIFGYRRFLDLAPGAATAPMARELLADSEKQLEVQQRAEAAQAQRAELARADAPKRDRALLPALPPATSAATASPLGGADGAKASTAPPLTHQWWFWAGVGVVAASAAGAAVALSGPPAPRVPTLGSINGR